MLMPYHFAGGGGQHGGMMGGMGGYHDGAVWAGAQQHIQQASWGGNMMNPVNDDDATNPLYRQDQFRMYCLKVLPCSKRFCHDWTTCPFAHPAEKAKRRDPRVFTYTGVACPEMKKQTSVCPRGDQCPYAHNVFEYWLHPSRYRTQLCNDGVGCQRKICFFAHTLEELRVSSVKVLNPDMARAGGTDGSFEGLDPFSHSQPAEGGRGGENTGPGFLGAPALPAAPSAPRKGASATGGGPQAADSSAFSMQDLAQLAQLHAKLQTASGMGGLGPLQLQLQAAQRGGVGGGPLGGSMLDPAAVEQLIQVLGAQTPQAPDAVQQHVDLMRMLGLVLETSQQQQLAQDGRASPGGGMGAGGADEAQGAAGQRGQMAALQAQQSAQAYQQLPHGGKGAGGHHQLQQAAMFHPQHQQQQQLMQQQQHAAMLAMGHMQTQQHHHPHHPHQQQHLHQHQHHQHHQHHHHHQHQPQHHQHHQQHHHQHLHPARAPIPGGLHSAAAHHRRASSGMAQHAVQHSSTDNHSQGRAVEPSRSATAQAVQQQEQEPRQEQERQPGQEQEQPREDKQEEGQGGQLLAQQLADLCVEGAAAAAVAAGGSAEAPLPAPPASLAAPGAGASAAEALGALPLPLPAPRAEAPRAPVDAGLLQGRSASPPRGAAAAAAPAAPPSSAPTAPQQQEQEAAGSVQWGMLPQQGPGRSAPGNDALSAQEAGGSGTKSPPTLEPSMAAAGTDATV